MVGRRARAARSTYTMTSNQEALLQMYRRTILVLVDDGGGSGAGRNDLLDTKASPYFRACLFSDLFQKSARGLCVGFALRGVCVWTPPVLPSV